MDSLARNVRLGMRSLRRAPGFAAVTVLTLTLGIGLATAVLTVADALLLRRLPVADEGSVVVLSGATPDGRTDDYPLGYAAARDFAARTRTLERVALFGYEGAAPTPVVDGGRISRFRRALVSGEYFAVLGARPVIGRALRDEDDARGAPPVLVLSHRAWRQRFGGAADVVGRRIVMHADGVAYTVVGVMPPGLDFPRGVDGWAAIRAATPERALPMLAYELIGRLAPGATPTRAREEMSAYFRRDGAAAWERELRGVARTLPTLVVGETRPAVIAFAAASGLLLLITCIDVANLLLVRGIGRVREIAVRSALGASRGQVVAQLLTEHALLAVAGGVLGVAVAAAAVRGFVAVAPPGLPRLDEIRLSGTALAGALGITAASMLIFGLAPALLTSRVEVPLALGSGSRQSAGRRARLLREALVAGQIGLALLVLSAAGLIGRSFLALERADLAFEPAHVLIAELALRADEYATAPKQIAMLDRLLPAVRAIPGVESVSPVVAAPFSGPGGWDGTFAAEGQTAGEAATNPVLNMELVAPSYFATLGVSVVRGRGFTEADREGAPSVVVLSQSAARHYWRGADPIGKVLTMGTAPRQRTMTVVGVVPDTRYRDLREARASVYFPIRQSFFPFAPTTLAIRTRGAPADATAALRRVLDETTPGVALASAAPFASFLAGPLAQPRMNATLLAVFASAAVVLAAVGLFGVLATMVRQRTRELGVRMALGATAGDVATLVLRRGMTLAAAGTAAGLLGALAANRVLASLLYEVGPTDAPTLAAVALGLLGVAALASLLPARSSARIEPAIALRAE